MIDPTQCSLDQLFFLLGFSHGLREGTPKTIFDQLRSSPILATFSPATQEYLSNALDAERKKLAPDFPSSSTPSKKVTYRHSKKRNNRTRYVA